MEGQPFTVGTYDVFGPKALSSRRPFRDQALESRCLTPPLRLLDARELRPEIPLWGTARFQAEAQQLRNKLLLWRFRNYRRVTADPTDRIPGKSLRTQALGLLLEAVTTEAEQDLIDDALDYATIQEGEARSETVEAEVLRELLRQWNLIRQRPGGTDLLNRPRISLLRADVNRTRMENGLGPITGKLVGQIVRGFGVETERVSGGFEVTVTQGTFAALTTAAVKYGLDQAEPPSPMPPPCYAPLRPRRRPARKRRTPIP
jgi:hypothetical protein